MHGVNLNHCLVEVTNNLTDEAHCQYYAGALDILAPFACPLLPCVFRALAGCVQTDREAGALGRSLRLVTGRSDYDDLRRNCDYCVRKKVYIQRD